MKLKSVLIVIISCFLSFSSFADEVKKMGIDIEHIPKLNRDVKISREDFEKATQPITEMPLADKYLAYHVRLGKDWAKAETSASNNSGDQLSKQILGNVVLYLGPANLDLRSSFRIRAGDLPFDMTVKDWFLNYIFLNNFSLQGMDFPDEKHLQAQYVTVENGQQNIVRASMQISGTRIIMAEYIVPIEFWASEKDMAKYSMASFALDNFDPSPIEQMNPFSFVDIAQFEYPASWSLRAPPISSIERMAATITNLKGGAGGGRKYKLQSGIEAVLVDGKIDISLVTKAPEVTLNKELAEIKKQLSAKGLVLGNLVEPVNGWKHHPAITSSHIEVYTINNSKGQLSNYEQWIGVFETPGRFYFVQLLTVGRQDNFLTWARNVQAYKHVIESLAPVPQGAP